MKDKEESKELAKVWGYTPLWGRWDRQAIVSEEAGSEGKWEVVCMSQAHTNDFFRRGTWDGEPSTETCMQKGLFS